MNDGPATEASPDGAADQRATPVMAQYLEIKTANPGSLLFYRMGDFYELFFHDAEIAARMRNNYGIDPLGGSWLHIAEGMGQNGNNPPAPV